MATEFPFVKISRELARVAGKRDEGTRVYRAKGSDEECAAWFEALNEHIPGGFVSPGGVSMFANVSRAAVYGRIKRGGLTAFVFEMMSREKRSFALVKRVERQTFMYVPVSECRAWGKEIEARVEERQQVERDDADKRNRGGESLLQLPRKGKRGG
jgi:hypothetical protein